MFGRRQQAWDAHDAVALARDHAPGGVVESPLAGGTATAVAAASSVSDDCPVEIAADRLRDCEGRTWTFAGLPIDATDPPLQRFPVDVDAGAVIVDFTRTVDGG